MAQLNPYIHFNGNADRRRAYFGMFADKYGIEWMVDFTPNNHGQN